MIRGVLLAAGASRRMGRDKLALPWRSTTVLNATLQRWLAVPQLGQILVVVRSEAQQQYTNRVKVLVNPSPDEGMGSSLRLAAQALPTDTQAVVVGLGDMPEVSSTTISTLVAAWRPLGPEGIVAPVFRGRRGHPVVFGATHIAELSRLEGDTGARTLLQQCASHVVLVDVEDPGTLLDLDSPADFGVQP